MENDKEATEKVNKKIQFIEDYISLSLRREDVGEYVEKLLTDLKDVHQLLAVVKSRLQFGMQDMEKEHENIMDRMQSQQKLLLSHVIAERERKVKQAQEEETKLARLTAGSDGSDLNNPNNGGVTPKFTLSEYKQSPLVKRCNINPIPFMLLDFDYQVTQKDFETIPKYMRGRDTLDELNNFLESVIISCFNYKYKLLHRHRDSIRNPQELELWKVFNRQVTYVPGRNFVTPGDISHHVKKMVDKKMLNRIVMLRHIGVLQEQRVSHTVCYIWAAGNKSK